VKKFTQYSITGIVLNSIPFKEHDKIVTLFTANFGKISGYAKGAARTSKNYPGGVEISDIGSFKIRAAGGGGMVKVDSFLPLKSSVGGANALYFLSSASLLLEVVERLTPEVIRVDLEELSGSGANNNASYRREERCDYAAEFSSLIICLEMLATAPRDQINRTLLDSLVLMSQKLGFEFPKGITNLTRAILWIEDQIGGTLKGKRCALELIAVAIC
jgi:hypothetical protein